MSTTWNLTREQIATKALQKVGNLARGETADPDDVKIATDALDGLLKELPIFGYAWPQVTPGAVIVVLAQGSGTGVMPADYYDGAAVTYLDAAGNEHKLPLVSPAEWAAIPRKTDAGTYPQKCFIDAGDTLHVWPVPPASVQIRLFYSRVLSDTATGNPVGLDASFTLGLVYGISAEIGDEFGATEAQMARWRGEWAVRRGLGIKNHAQQLPACMSVDD